METIHKTTSNGEHLMDLPVTYQGRSIAVGAGSLRFFNDTRPFAADSVDIPARPNVTVVRGFIVRLAQDSSYQLFVDEWEQDGVDAPWQPDRADPFECMAQLFQLDIPAGGAALDALPVHRWIIVQRAPDAPAAPAEPAKEG